MVFIMNKLKVFGGLTFLHIGDKTVQVRAIVSGASRKKAYQTLAATNKSISFHHFLGYWSETGNIKELEAAKNAPETVVIFHE